MSCNTTCVRVCVHSIFKNHDTNATHNTLRQETSIFLSFVLVSVSEKTEIRFSACCASSSCYCNNFAPSEIWVSSKVKLNEVGSRKREDKRGSQESGDSKVNIKTLTSRPLFRVHFSKIWLTTVPNSCIFHCRFQIWHYFCYPGDPMGRTFPFDRPLHLHVEIHVEICVEIYFEIFQLFVKIF